MTTIKKINDKNILEAVKALKRGNLVCFPTETVYGLGADATNNLAIAKIFNAKNRPSFNPIIVHVSSKNMVERLGILTSLSEKIIETFCPGPLTIILERKKDSGLSDLLSAGLKTTAFRIPDNSVAIKLLKNFNKPIAAPSANKSGYLSPTKAEHVYDQFKNNKDIPIILDDGKTKVGLESTVVYEGNNNIKILRHGGISKELLEDSLKIKIIDDNKNTKFSKNLIAPGMLKKHYSPKVPLRINATHKKNDEILLGFGPDYEEPNLSKKGNLVEAAANLFSFLSIYEKKGKKIAIAPIPNNDIGRAINDRITRASSSRNR